MIVLELNGHLSHAVPLMVCVLSSYATSEYIKPQSFFEMLSSFSGLDDKKKEKNKIVVKDWLDLNPAYTEVDFISLMECDEKELIRLVKKNLYEGDNAEYFLKDKPQLKYIPVVDCVKNKNLLYMVKTTELYDQCVKYFGPIDLYSPPGAATNLK